MSIPLAEIVESTEFISALAGSFSGVILGAALKASYDYWAKRNALYEAIAKAQTVLALQLNDIEGLDRQYLAGRKNLPLEERARALGPVFYPFTPARVELTSLIFLSTAGFGKTFMEVSIAERSFVNAVEAVAMIAVLHEKLRVEVKYTSPVRDDSSAGVALDVKAQVLDRQIRDQVQFLYERVPLAKTRLIEAANALDAAAREILEKRPLFFTSPPSLLTISIKDGKIVREDKSP